MNAPNRRNLLILLPALVLATILISRTCLANVSHGSREAATNYYHLLSKMLNFSTPDNIFSTTLDDVAAYLGYSGITGADLQNLDPSVLMNPDQLLTTNSLSQLNTVIAALGATTIRPHEILACRFFAPKVMNINDPPETRKRGWRKLVRLRSRAGSAAGAHQIAYGIILFNFFTPRGTAPFTAGDNSVNTQVMLVTAPAQIPAPGKDGPSTLYWLDYDNLGNGGKLSLALHASFDAIELPPGSDGNQDYFVPDGCVACHGNNEKRSMVNYLDTDHWFDRLDTDLGDVKQDGLNILFDAKTNDTKAREYISAFDVIRRFNEEADEEVHIAQPKHDEALASKKWLELHATSVEHVAPAARAIGLEPRWSAASDDDNSALAAMNQNCFRCHGTVKFSVFNKQSVHSRRANAKERLKPNAEPGMKMPPDHTLPEDVRSFIFNHLP
jgi:hypothetical protein